MGKGVKDRRARIVDEDSVTFAVEAEFALGGKLHAFNLIDYQG